MLLLNAGILASELVGNSCGTTVRRVTYQLPETGEKISFITNIGPQIPPGIIAQLYFIRWQIEKASMRSKQTSRTQSLSHKLPIQTHASTLHHLDLQPRPAPP